MHSTIEMSFEKELHAEKAGSHKRILSIMDSA